LWGAAAEGARSGGQVEEYRGILKVSYPMEHGVPGALVGGAAWRSATNERCWRRAGQVNNWEDMEHIWQH
jgi:hypothetical protein